MSNERNKIYLIEPIIRLESGVLTHGALIGTQGDKENGDFAMRQMVAINTHDVLERSVENRKRLTKKGGKDLKTL